MAAAGVNETAARLPGALLALAALAALGWAGAGLYGRRAGLFAAAVLATSPLFVLQARQLTSDASLLLGHALVVGALARLAGPARPRLPVAPLVLGALGLALSTLAAGVLMGALPPLAAGLGAALLGGGDQDGQPDGRDRPLARPVLTALAIATGLVVLGIALRSYTAGVPSWWLGGVPTGASPSHSFETLLRVHGFGLFPFTALAALALLQPLAGPAATRSDADGTGVRFGDGLVSLLAALGLALGAAQLHLTGEARLVALLPAALATGRLLDQLADRARDPAGLPALALGSFAAIGTILCTRDLSQNPEQLVSLHLRSKLTWPPGLDVGWLLALGIAAALAALILTARPPGESRPARWLRRAQPLAPAALLAASGVLVLVLAHHLVPALSLHLSTKHLVDGFHRHAGPGAAMALVPGASLGSAMFQRAPTQAVADTDALARAFRERPSLFALVPRSDLATIQDRFSESGTRYVVADASSSRLLLLAARPLPGQPDQNPLHRVLWRPDSGNGAAPPWPPPRLPLTSTFASAIQLVGADLPATLRRPGPLPLTLFFRVTARPPAGYKIFVHLERAGGFLTGDHPPLEDLFPTGLWRPGDLLRDQHAVAIPLVVTASGSYAVHVGFWPGGDNARRLPVTGGPSDGRDRVHVATVVVK
jgi:hypothetical protein